MKAAHAILFFEILPLAINVGSSDAQSLAPPFILETPVMEAPGRYILKTEPDLRYDLWESTDLQSWVNVSGWPRRSAGLSLEHVFSPTSKRFFRSQEIDEQPPTIINLTPRNSAFAVGRFTAIRVELSDASGIDPTSLRLTVGEAGQMALGAPGLNFSENVVLYNPGDSALGGYGQTISATLVVSDTKGNSLTHSWNFTLESEPKVASEVYVFGSSIAQQGGQKIDGPGAEWANRFAKRVHIPNDNSQPWVISNVLTDRVVIAYTDANPPTFSINQFICNLCPTRVEQIFYRRVTSLANNVATHELTLMTTNVLLTDMVETGSVAVNKDSVFFVTQADGTLTRAGSFAGEVSFPRIGFDVSDSSFSLKNDGFKFTLVGSISPPPLRLSPTTLSAGDGPEILSCSARECSFWFTPAVRAEMEISSSTLKKFEILATGTLQTQTVCDLKGLLRGVAIERELYNLPFASEPKVTLLLGTIGPIPVFATLSLDFTLKAKAELGSSLNFSFGQRSECSASLGFSYDKDHPIRFMHDITASVPDIIIPSLGLSVDGSVRFSAEPQLKFLVYGIAGAAVGIEAYAELTSSAALGVPSNVGLKVGVNATLKPSGPALEQLNLPEAEHELWSKEWIRSSQPLAIESGPTSVTIPDGQTATFSVNAKASEAINYQWYHKGLPIPGASLRSLIVPHVNPGHSGAYKVILTAGNQTLESRTVTLSITPVGILDSDRDGIPDIVETNTGMWLDSNQRGTNPYRWDSDGDGLSDLVETNTGIYVSTSNTGTDPNTADSDADGIPDRREVFLGTDPGGGTSRDGFAYIPAGTFLMGDQSAPTIGHADEKPVQNIYVGAFYLARTEVTKAQWDITRTWAIDNGYSFVNSGSGKSNNHPVHSVNWYDAVKWCNARSQQEGLEPCFKVKGAIYKAGEQSAVTCDFSANGYRLPTEAEWEKAARGAMTGYNFPWGNYITHKNANYYSIKEEGFDVSETRGYHPTFNDGVFPFTSPVGSFAANGYGLFDMAGNVWEACWDWYDADYYGSSPLSDPHGPESGVGRSFRGGSWGHSADSDRVSLRINVNPTSTYKYNGCRVARGAVDHSQQ